MTQRGITISMSGYSIDGRSSEDGLTQFCEDLSIPIEELTNVVYLALRSGPDTSDSQRYLLVADKILAGVRETVLGHCRRKAA